MGRLLSILVLGIGFSESAWGQQTDPEDPAEPRLQIANLDEFSSHEGVKQVDRLSVAVGAGLVTDYISRGVLFAGEASLQPYVTVTFALPELEGSVISDANAFVGSWSSVKLGSVPPGPSGRLNRFYETDLYAGAAVMLAEHWAVSATYYRYESLSDSFEGYNDLELVVSFDDSEWWEGAVPLDNFTLSPALRLVQEAGRPDREDALYVQPSVTPSFNVDIGQRRVRIGIPLIIGLSDDYYDGVDGEKKTFGFFRTGLTASGQPAPEDLPALNISGGVDLWVPNTHVASGLDKYDFVGNVSIAWSF